VVGKKNTHSRAATHQTSDICNTIRVSSGHPPAINAIKTAMKSTYAIRLGVDAPPRKPDHSQAPASITNAIASSATTGGATNTTSPKMTNAITAVITRCFNIQLPLVDRLFGQIDVVDV